MSTQAGRIYHEKIISPTDPTRSLISLIHYTMTAGRVSVETPAKQLSSVNIHIEYGASGVPDCFTKERDIPPIYKSGEAGSCILKISKGKILCNK